MRLRLIAISSAASFLLAAAGTTKGSDDVTIVRDQFGVPHIFATTEEGAAFGMGYAQAQDRLEELLKQYRRATGTMSEAFGKQHFRDDYRQRLWQHAEMSRTKYAEISEKGRST